MNALPDMNCLGWRYFRGVHVTQHAGMVMHALPAAVAAWNNLTTSQRNSWRHVGREDAQRRQSPAFAAMLALQCEMVRGEEDPCNHFGRAWTTTVG